MADQKLNITEKPDLDKARSRVRQEIPVVRDEIVVPERLIQFAQGKKYFIRTYGCQANVRDEENMRGLLELTGFTSVDDEKLADFVIINTCAIRENAEDKVFGELGILKGLKASSINKSLKFLFFIYGKIKRLISSFRAANRAFREALCARA